MRIFKFFSALAFATLFAANAVAQECPAKAEAQDLGYWPQPYGFVQAQGGLNTIFSPGKQFNPTFSLGAGYMFSPAVGLRLHANGYEAKNGFRAVNDTYKFKYINSNLDVLVNLTNFGKTHNHLVNLYLVAGVGLAYAWDNDEFQAIANAKTVEDCSNAWGKGTTRESLLSHNIRAGLLLDFNIAKHWSLGAEVDINNLSDRFDSKYNDNCDWMATAQLSLTYKFGFKKCEKPAPVVKEEPKPASVPAVVMAPKPEPKPVVKEEPKPVVKEEPLKEVLYFSIRESNPINEEVITKVKNWLNKYTDKNITLSAYADKGTGNAKLNMKYSTLRMKAAVNALKNAGIPESRIDAKAYGDTVQPFPNNDDNRCVIIIGE